MRKILTFILLIIALTSNSQSKIGSEKYGLNINMESVNRIYIAAYCSPIDSCRGTLYLLKNEMAVDLIDKLNKSESKVRCNITEEYLLYIHFNDGTVRNFKINSTTIKDIDEKCFDFGYADYFENLWLLLDKEWIELNKK